MDTRNNLEASNKACSCNEEKVCRCKLKGGSGCLNENCNCKPQKDNKNNS